MSNFVLLATAWGPRFGGVNSFNRDFAVGLATALGASGKVYCAVLQADDASAEEAERHGVTLISLKEVEGAEFRPNFIPHLREVLKETLGVSNVDCWVGHDVISGEAAVRASQKGGKAALIMHMSYRDYQAPKHPGDASALEGDEKQRKLFFNNTNATLFAVGPLLRDACKRLAKRDAIMLVPGFPEGITEGASHLDALSAITFGRMSVADDRIKNGRLAIESFARAVGDCKTLHWAPAPLRNSPSLCIFGLDSDYEIADVQQTANQNAGGLVNVLAQQYSLDRDKLFDELSRANLAFMLSWHEGFGLSGWEAVAAGLPLIVSKNSGLYRLTEELPGAWEGCLLGVDIKGGDEGRSDDVKNVSEKIKEAAANLEHRRAKACELRDFLKTTFDGCRWEATARSFLIGIGFKPESVSKKDPKRPENGPKLETKSVPPTSIKVELRLEFDVFISYSSEKGEWVRNILLPRVEAAGFRAFIDYRDFKPGQLSLKEMERGVKICRKTIVVLTPDYVNSEWCEKEADMLLSLSPSNGNSRLLPLLKEPCEIPLRWQSNFIDFTAKADHDLAWKKLFESLTDPSEPSKKDTEGDPAPDRSLRPSSSAWTDMEAIKQRMVNILKTSGAATDALRRALNLDEKRDAPPGGSKGGRQTRTIPPLPQRAHEAIEALVETPFREGALALNQSVRQLSGTAKKDVDGLAEYYACLLVGQEDLLALHQARRSLGLGVVVTLPTDNETLVEIILARQVGEKPEFAVGDKWPRGFLAIPCPPIRNNPDDVSEILQQFQNHIETVLLAKGEAIRLKNDPQKKRERCNNYLKNIADKGERQMYFLLDELGDYQHVGDILKELWPHIIFIRFGEDIVDDRASIIDIIKDLFGRKTRGDNESY